MKRMMDVARITGASAAVVLVLTACGGSGNAATPEPPRQGSIVDAADVLTSAEEQSLNALIVQRNSATDAARVAVLTVDGAGGSIEDYARSVATAWGVGDQGADNGVLIVADTGERELRIETADGVRDALSDDDAESIIDDVLEPAFADEEYARGLTDAVGQVYLYAEGGEPVREPFNTGLLAALLAGSVLLIGALTWWLVADLRRRRRAADEELRTAEKANPDFRVTDQQRDAYRKYRYHKRGDDAVSNPVVWLPLYAANPALYSGGNTGGSSGSSNNGGGGFTGGGASGSY